MSKKNRHIEHLTPELIRAYRNGELTHEQQHEVERLMLENPLYQEAMEGLENLTDEMLDADLAELNSRLDSLLSEEEQKTGFWTIWRGIAAAAVLILAISSLYLLNQDKPVPNKLLTENKKIEKADSISKDSQTTKEEDDLSNSITKADSVEDDEEITLDLAFEEPELELDIDRIELDAKTLIAESLAEFKDDSLNLVIPMNKLDSTMEKAIADIELAKVLEDQAAGIESQARLRMQQSLAAPAPRAAVQNPLTIKGTVVGADDGLGLPQVSILRKGTKEGTSTNLDGEFTIQNVAPNSTLVFRYLGYVTQEVAINSDSTLKVSLEPDIAALGEVVVTGYGEAEKKEISFSTERAKPLVGYPEYNKYLSENLRYPEEAKAENIKGRVTVEFTIEADGSLTNFEIIKGLGYGCDEEAIRLIKEGPKWRPKTEGVNETAVSSKVRVRIRFRP